MITTTKDYLHKLFQIYKESTKDISGDESDYDFKSKDAEACFIDFERTLLLHESLSKVIEEKIFNPNMTPSRLSNLLEAGSGTGIIAILSAQKFPDLKITCVEINEITAKKSIEFIKALKLEKQIEVLNLDILNLPANSLKLTANSFEIIFSETLSGGLFFEPQIQIVQSIKKYLKPNGILIPKKISLFLHLESPSELTPLTEKIKYAEIDFQTYEQEYIKANIEIPIIKSGTPNIIVISSELYLSDEIKTESNPKYHNFLNRAILQIPKNQQKELKEGEKVGLYIKYKAGNSTNDVKILLFTSTTPSQLYHL